MERILSSRTIQLPPTISSNAKAMSFLASSGFIRLPIVRNLRRISVRTFNRKTGVQTRRAHALVEINAAAPIQVHFRKGGPQPLLLGFVPERTVVRLVGLVAIGGGFCDRSGRRVQQELNSNTGFKRDLRAVSRSVFSARGDSRARAHTLSLSLSKKM